MKVSEVMTTGLVAVKPEDTLSTAVQRMVMRRYASLPVTNDDDALIGIVTIRDTMLPIYPNFEEHILDTMNVRDIMVPEPMAVSPDDSVLQAASYMDSNKLPHIPVIDDGKLVGMISIGDIKPLIP